MRLDGASDIYVLMVTTPPTHKDRWSIKAKNSSSLLASSRSIYDIVPQVAKPRLTFVAFGPYPNQFPSGRNSDSTRRRAYLFCLKKSSHLELKSTPVPSRLKDGWRESNPSIMNFYSLTGLEQLALQALADYF